MTLFPNIDPSAIFGGGLVKTRDNIRRKKQWNGLSCWNLELNRLKRNFI